MRTQYFHGGKAGLKPGEWLVPSSPHGDDDCLICVARREGRGVTVAEYREWLIREHGERAAPVLRALEGALDHEVIDPPSAREAVYISTERDYARWYAARSRGDLYRVEPDGDLDPSEEDRFESFTVPRARVVEVLERKVRLTRKDRRSLMREWGKRDRRARGDTAKGPSR